MTTAQRDLLAYAAELAALRAQPCLFDADTARLPVLAAALGVAVRVERCEWGSGETVRTMRVVGEVRE